MANVKSYNKINNTSYSYNNLAMRTVRVSNTISSISIVGDSGDSGKIADKLVSIKFSPNITKIDDYCCYNATNLTAVSTTNTKIIGNNAFQNCSALSSYDALNNGTAIYAVGDYAFANSGIKNAILNIQNIDDATYDYQGCVATTLDAGPYSGHYAFANCKQLTSVKFLRSTELGPHMFDGCTKLTTVQFGSENTTAKINEMSGSCVGEYAFANCTSLKSIKLPYRFEVISKGMFCNCTSLSSVQILSSAQTDAKLISIEDYAFKNCPKLEKLTLPTQVNDISLFSINCLAGSNIKNVELCGVTSANFDKYYKLSTHTVTKTITAPVTAGFELGKWYTNQIAAIHDAAKETHIPLIVKICGNGCGRCTAFDKTTASSQDFKDWVKNSPYFFAYLNCSTENSKDKEEFVWKFLKTNSKTWQGHTNSERSSISFVQFAYVWYKPDGTLAVDIPFHYLNGSNAATEFKTIKSAAESVFSGYQFDPSQLSTKVVGTQTTTEQVVITDESFLGWGLDHECIFKTRDSIGNGQYKTTQFKYTPNAGLALVS